MIAEIRRTFDVCETQEISVDAGGNNFLVIYGHHINGWFIAIPNWEVCTEAGHPTSIDYNTEKLKNILGNDSTPCALAEAICKHWDRVQQEGCKDG